MSRPARWGVEYLPAVVGKRMRKRWGAWWMDHGPEESFELRDFEEQSDAAAFASSTRVDPAFVRLFERRGIERGPYGWEWTETDVDVLLVRGAP